jgi:hypothetical protein
MGSKEPVQICAGYYLIFRCNKPYVSAYVCGKTKIILLRICKKPYVSSYLYMKCNIDLDIKNENTIFILIFICKYHIYLTIYMKIPYLS